MTYLLLDTSTPRCGLWVVSDDGVLHDYSWQADRTLARALLSRISDALKVEDRALADIHGIGVYTGPGSYTGLRIGITVANTLAESLVIPIVGAYDSETWRAIVLRRLAAGENDRIIVPHYGGDAIITTQKK